MRRDKDCPYKKHCGDWDNCGDCDYHEAFEALRNKIAYHKRRADRLAAALAEKENPTPLTLKELRQMEGEPVWVKIIDASNFCDPKDAFEDYGLVRKSWVRMWDRSRADIITVSHHFEEYGKTWLAYRHKPKEETPC